MRVRKVDRCGQRVGTISCLKCPTTDCFVRASRQNDGSVSIAMVGTTVFHSRIREVH